MFLGIRSLRVSLRLLPPVACVAFAGDAAAQSPTYSCSWSPRTRRSISTPQLQRADAAETYTWPTTRSPCHPPEVRPSSLPAGATIQQAV